MRKSTDCVRICNEKGGVWKLAAVILFFAFVLMAMTSVCLKRQNKKYCKTIVKMSENFPNTKEQDKKLAELRRKRRNKSRPLTDEKTLEEKIAEREITEEE